MWKTSVNPQLPTTAVENVEKSVLQIHQNNLDWPVSLDVVGIWEICARKKQVNVFALRCVSYMNINSFFLMWCAFLQQIAWEKWVLCYWYEYLSWWWTSVWSAEHLDPVIFDWIKVPCCIWMRLDGLCSLVRDSGSSSLYPHQLLFLAGVAGGNNLTLTLTVGNIIIQMPCLHPMKSDWFMEWMEMCDSSTNSHTMKLVLYSLIKYFVSWIYCLFISKLFPYNCINMCPLTV